MCATTLMLLSVVLNTLYTSSEPQFFGWVFNLSLKFHSNVGFCNFTATNVCKNRNKTFLNVCFQKIKLQNIIAWARFRNHHHCDHNVVGHQYVGKVMGQKQTGDDGSTSVSHNNNPVSTFYGGLSEGSCIHSFSLSGSLHDVLSRCAQIKCVLRFRTYRH